jgi:hypothetical protein
MKVVADRLGHANAAMTLRVYRHLTDQASALAVAALDKSLTASPEAQTSNTSSSDETEFVDSTVDSEHKKNAFRWGKWVRRLLKWRRGWDSNPRYGVSRITV